MKTIVFVCAGAFLGWAAAESGFGLAPAADAEVHEGGLVASAGVGRGSRGSEDPPRRAVLLDDVEQPKDGDDKYFPGYIAGAVGALFCCSWRLCFCRFCLRPREPPANTPPADGSENATVSYPGAPDHFLCPITLDVMRDPVVCVDRHHTFEKRAIQQYLGEGHPECPVSRRRMVPADLAPDPALRTEIKAWLAVQHQNALVAAGLLAVVIEAVRAQEQGEAASCGGARCCTLPDSAAALSISSRTRSSSIGTVVELDSYCEAIDGSTSASTSTGGSPSLPPRSCSSSIGIPIELPEALPVRPNEPIFHPLAA